MVEIETVRSFRVEGNDFIAIKTDTYENGKGNKVVRVLEEHNISEQEIEEVINKLSTEELQKVNEERGKLSVEIKEMRKEIKKVVESEKYLKFKKMLKREETGKLFEVVSKEKTLNRSEHRLKQLSKTTLDIIAWREQFESLKEKINNQ